MLLPFLGKNDEQRRVIINSIGPTWEGNQVWFVMVGGALFAAWPMAYAVFFSGLYFVLLLVLFALFLRPLGFDYRSKLPSQKWRYNWDKALFIGGFVPALVFGMGFGNLLQGIPFQLENDMRIIYSGSFWELFNPFAIFAGLMSLSLFAMHGAVYLQMRTVGDIHQRAKKAVLIFTLLILVFFALGGYWISFLDGYHITSEVFPNGASNPLAKIVKREPGLWLDNYGHFTEFWLVPSSVFFSSLITIRLSQVGRAGTAFVFSCFTVTAIILTAGCSMFPFIIPSSVDLKSSLTVWDSSSSLATLHMLFWLSVIFLPLIVIYTSWVFRVLRGKITVEYIRKNDHTAY